ncbi:CPBP family intramembrane glutamic endopeptidase [Calycomorphotria hydatis]|uniref:CAAX amino terminal protease self-immunity n=1 Tax=Calycomorphotria hydatis TaxID=2528027 RepID=A0A517T883_9PLAN|nr:CPBP family intramembrane glutamic endopeptidase [Calycomorphotria hydatis]QDT64572.1 CAAX amino terminal protease self- immunity [Calycomorphotria hydatis]
MSAGTYTEMREERETKIRADEYWEQARRPFPCLLFLAPLLIIYEIGVLAVGGLSNELHRSGADIWLRGWLYEVGLQHSFVLPAIVAVLLLAWNFYGYFDWRCKPETLFGMFAESLLFAFGLVVVGRLLEMLFQTAGLEVMAAGDVEVNPLRRMLVFVGAGIYEEVLFRLLLLPICYAIFLALRTGPMWAGVLSVLLSSLAFSLAHYIGPLGDQIVPFTFCFRALAGVFFAVLFMTRGFGITVGCHTAYDLIVGVLLETAMAE